MDRALPHFSNKGEPDFGFWPEGSANLSLTEARLALIGLLCDRLPQSPCRVALIAREAVAARDFLVAKGYHVEHLPPEQAIRLLENRRLPTLLWNTAIVLECFQDFCPCGSFLNQLREWMVPGGLLIIAGELCQDTALRPSVHIPAYKEIVVGLLEAGYRIKSDRSIGGEVYPTFDAAAAENPLGGPSGIANLSRWRLRQQLHASGQLGYQIIVATRDDLFMRPYRDGDEGHILSLFQVAFGHSRTLAHWQWKFRDNPFGRHRIAEAVSAEGDLAAHFGSYPVPFYVHHASRSDWTTFQAGDTMTHPSFRGSGRGPTALLSRIATYFYNRFCVDRVPFIYGFNTGKIRRFGERFLQYEYIPEVRLHTLPAEQLNCPRSHFWGMRLLGFSVTPLIRIDDEFDRFFDRVCADYGMLVKRCADYLRWRYLECPDSVHRMYALRRFGRLLGWGTFSCRGNVLVWGDALFAKNAVNSLGFFLSRLVQRFFPNIERIEAWFSPRPAWWAAALSKTGFEIGDEPNHLAPAFRIFDTRFSTALFEQNLYYAMGDSDLF